MKLKKKKKASVKKATATKEAKKKDTASAKPADTAKVGSKDERTSPPSKKAKRQEKFKLHIVYYTDKVIYQETRSVSENFSIFTLFETIKKINK